MGRVCALAGCLLATGCTDVDGFTADQWSIIETLSPRPELPEVPTNPVADDPAAAILGQRLYFDEGLGAAVEVAHPEGGPGVGEAGRVACSTCHAPADAYADGRGSPTWATSLGVKWTPRNAPTVLDAAHYQWFLWDGRAATLWQAVTVAVEVGAAQNANRLAVIRHVARNYGAAYEDVFGAIPADIDVLPTDASPASGDPELVEAWEDMSETDRVVANAMFANFARAVAAYLRLVVTGQAPFDDYVAGDRDALDDAAKRGLALFIGRARCVECHSGPSFTDNEFHNIGLPQAGEHVKDPDTGREEGLVKLRGNDFTPDDALEGLEEGPGTVGAFRTPSLRNVARTGPYMHTGGAATLEEVVSFYNWGGHPDGYPGVQHPLVSEPLGLSEVEEADLVAFLETLSGELPSGELGEPPP